MPRFLESNRKTILEEELELLRGLKDFVEDWSIGERYIAIKLVSGKCGVAYRPREVFSYPDYLSIKDKDAISVANLALSNNLGERAIGIAVINALTNLKGARYGDPLDHLDVRDKILALVGYFHPVIDRYSSLAKDIRVIERLNIPEAYPPEKAEEVLKEADIVIITGSALIYGGMEDYLEYSKGKEVLVLGPTSSMRPEPFFKRGASVVGGIEILDSQKLFASPKQCKDLFNTYTRKIYFDRSDFADFPAR